MEKVVQFLLEHWALSGLFALLLVVFLVNEFRNRSFGIPSVNCPELVNLINHSRAAVIDIRDEALFSGGHIIGATHLRQQDFEAKKNTFNKFKARPMVVVCEQGAQSPKAAQWLLDQGFKEIYYLKGGLQAWRAENMPVTKAS